MLFTGLTTLAFLAAAWISGSEGKEYYDVACPGVFGDLECPDGQTIDSLKIEHGNKNDANCAARDQAATVSPERCFDTILNARLVSHCAGLRRCNTPESTPMLFGCDGSADFFVQYTYTCKDESPDTRVAKACQGESVDLKCEQGTISVQKALFGRVDPDTCTATPSSRLYCTSYGAEAVVMEQCNGKADCKMRAITDYLGMPSHCDDLPKYLLVKYLCK
ncbi:L-rhamnose-binding lectin CSL3-like [Brachionichthys hirsutus]|uniref:L-rhamnose-binding lectin CSL3-like n=1 Tax=Brachionichthys hirsutus TaxID=412623 RepID=UPI0036048B7B